jgi:hypothetical protein
MSENLFTHSDEWSCKVMLGVSSHLPQWVRCFVLPLLASARVSWVDQWRSFRFIRSPFDAVRSEYVLFPIDWFRR